jgi:tetratricopeptide (TPR) repeat protein
VWSIDETPVGGAEAAAPRAARAAFARAGVPDGDEIFGRVNRILATYTRSWVAAFTDACEATHLRGEQSEEALDLRMACLQERLGAEKTLVDALAQADAAVVGRAVEASLRLPDLARCGDLALLRSAVRPPEGQAQRAEVERLRRRFGALSLLATTGRFNDVVKDLPALEGDIRRAGYPPLLADFLISRYEWLANGALGYRTELLREALHVAGAFGYEEGVGKALVDLVAADYRNADLADAWAEQADAILRHVGDPPVLRSWLDANAAVALFARGRIHEALERDGHALALKARRVPRDDSDVALTESDTCMFLQQLDRFDEALSHCQRAVALAAGVLGWRHPVTMNMIENRAWLLADMGRVDEARADAERARAFFQSIGEPTDTRASLLLALGRGALAGGDARAGRDLLARALAARVAAAATPLELAEVELPLAEAAWQAGEHARARELALRALDRYAAMPELAARQARARAWLDGHRASR